MNSTDVLVLGVMASLTAGSLAYHFLLSESARRRRRFQRMNSVSIAELRAGEVACVKGRVRALEGVLTGPLTGRSCVHYEVSRRRQRDRRDGWGWEVEAEDEAWVPFVVEDETGTVLVRPGGWVHVLMERRHVTAADEAHARASLDAVGRRLGYERTQFFTGFAMRIAYTELAIEEGSRVKVFGLVEGLDGELPPLAPGATYRDSQRVLALSPPGAEKLVIGPVGGG